MPAFLALAARRLPTSAAWALLAPLKLLGRLIQVAEASVLPARVVDELRRDAAVGAEYDQARPLGRAGDLLAHAPVTADASFACSESAHARLPTFRRTCSPE